MANVPQPLSYLPAPIVSPPVPSDENNSSKVVACTLALGILSYYSPRTFYAASAGLLGYGQWSFSPMVHQNPTPKAGEIRNWFINACTITFSLGVICGVRSAICFWSAAKALRHFHLLQTGGNLIAGIFTGCVALGLSFFQTRAKELMKTKNWSQMEDYLNLPAEIKKFPETKFAFCTAVIFPKSVPQNVSMILHQFKSPQQKKTILTHYFTSLKTIPDDSNTALKNRWIVAIHYFQELSFGDQETLMPELVKIGRKSRAQIDRLPHALSSRLRSAMETYRDEGPMSTPDLLKEIATWRRIPVVGTRDWETWVVGMNRFKEMNYVEQQQFLIAFKRCTYEIRTDQLDQLPNQFRKHFPQVTS